jgi:hypothetical protein
MTRVCASLARSFAALTEARADARSLSCFEFAIESCTSRVATVSRKRSDSSSAWRSFSFAAPADDAMVTVPLLLALREICTPAPAREGRGGGRVEVGGSKSCDDQKIFFGKFLWAFRFIRLIPLLGFIPSRAMPPKKGGGGDKKKPAAPKGGGAKGGGAKKGRTLFPGEVVRKPQARGAHTTPLLKLLSPTPSFIFHLVDTSETCT